eukprot:CAMPEP_0196222724 /NCGR_PEP_ID=MMETSP0912-20130531/45274_1 /TAXON_ID=49265 /ORGANISM="Thalassiosira rotula, Strain GSO102" /LENGTH=156 /DNA_ID=CAMNT_0041501595 /DNA_START=187 /DNA_END=657 /DNA_ORIENTATION=+
MNSLHSAFSQCAPQMSASLTMSSESSEFEFDASNFDTLMEMNSLASASSSSSPPEIQSNRSLSTMDTASSISEFGSSQFDSFMSLSLSSSPSLSSASASSLGSTSLSSSSLQHSQHYSQHYSQGLSSSSINSSKSWGSAISRSPCVMTNLSSLERV